MMNTKPMIAGDERTPLIQRPEAQPVLAEQDPDRYLAAYVDLITDHVMDHAWELEDRDLGA